VLADIELIASNAACYNGPKHEIAVDAREVVNKIKGELLRCFDKLGDSFIKHRIEQAKTVFSSVFLKQSLARELSRRSG
jgi:hypothetical protein